MPAFLALGFGASTLAAFVLATTVGLFGVTENWTGWAVWIAAAAEVVAIVAGARLLAADNPLPHASSRRTTRPLVVRTSTLAMSSRRDGRGGRDLASWRRSTSASSPTCSVRPSQARDEQQVVDLLGQLAPPPLRVVGAGQQQPGAPGDAARARRWPRPGRRPPGPSRAARPVSPPSGDPGDCGEDVLARPEPACRRARGPQARRARPRPPRRRRARRRRACVGGCGLDRAGQRGQQRGGHRLDRPARARGRPGSTRASSPGRPARSRTEREHSSQVARCCSKADARSGRERPEDVGAVVRSANSQALMRRPPSPRARAAAPAARSGCATSRCPRGRRGGAAASATGRPR